MPEFRYQAYDSTGRLVSGTVSAPHEADALRALHLQQLLPFRTVAASARPRTFLFRSSRRLGGADVVLVLRDLTTLLEAAVPVDRALKIAAAQTGSRRRRELLEELHQAVTRGSSLSEAMSAQADVFSRDQIAVARAGEVAGSLPEAFGSLYATLQRRREIKARITGAFVYPGILVAMALFALALIFSVLVPAITPLFEGGRRPMPPVLVAATAIMRFLEAYGYLLASLIIAVLVGCRALLRREEFRDRLDAAVLRTPLVGAFVRQAETARFARTFATLLGSGAPILSAVAVTAETLTNRRFRRAIAGIVDELKHGVRLGDALAAVDVLEEAPRSLISLGEETNRLAEMLGRVAEANEKELDSRIERFMTVLVPVLTLLIGVVVGGIILSVMNAILSTNDLAF